MKSIKKYLGALQGEEPNLSTPCAICKGYRPQFFVNNISYKGITKLLFAKWMEGQPSKIILVTHYSQQTIPNGGRPLWRVRKPAFIY